MKEKRRDFRKIFLKIIVWILIIMFVYILLDYPKFKYRKSFIIGKTRDQIEEKYGEFDHSLNDRTAYDINECFTYYILRRVIGGKPYTYYFIKYDDNGYAYKTYIGEDPYP